MSSNDFSHTPERLAHLERLPIFEEIASIAACLTGHSLRIYRPTASDHVSVMDFSQESILPARLASRLQTGPGYISGIQPDPAIEPFMLRTRGGIEYVAPVRVGETLLGFVRSGLVPTDNNQRGIAGNFLLRAMKKLTLLCASVVSATARSLGLLSANEVPKVARDIASFISTNRHSKLELNHVAANLGLSPSYVTELLKKHYGSGFRDFLTAMRLEDAANLLRSTEKPVSQIAYEVGFQSLSHFNRAFRKATGFTPTGYRTARS